MLRNEGLRQVNTDWGERVPTVHFVLDQDRLRAFGLTSSDASQQLQFLLTGVPVTQVREDIRSVEIVARTTGVDRLDPTKLGAFTLVGASGERIPLDQIGRAEVRMEDPILRRRDRLTTITVRGDIDERLQPPDGSAQVMKDLQPIIAARPATRSRWAAPSRRPARLTSPWPRSSR
jgi:multidrug efflux pump subunit AcrB